MEAQTNMAMGPTPPEPATEGKDLSGGFFRLKLSDGTHAHTMRVHVPSYSLQSGSYLYDTPPAGLFSDAGPDVTAAGLAALLTPFYLNSYQITLDALYRVIGGALVEQWPLPAFTPIVGAGVTNVNLHQTPAGQITLTTRDTLGQPFKLIMLGTLNWTPDAPAAVADNSGGNVWEKLVHYLAQNGAIRSHAGNKPIAPFKMQNTLNKRLRRAYHQI